MGGMIAIYKGDGEFYSPSPSSSAPRRYAHSQVRFCLRCLCRGVCAPVSPPLHPLWYVFLIFSLRLAQPSQAMFSVPVAPLLSSKKQPHASSQHVLFAVSLFLQIRSVSFAWTSLPADGARPAVIPTLSLATILLESSWQSARNSSCALIPTPAQSRRHAAWRTKSLGSQPKNLLLKRCLLFRRNLRTGSGPPRGTNKILLFSSVLPCCGLFS